MERSNYWTRRYSRRRTLAGAGAASAGLAGLALVGCGDDEGGGDSTATGTSNAGGSPTTSSGTGTAAATETPKRGDELVVGQGASGAQSMDPLISLNKAFTYWNLLTDKLVSPNPLSAETEGVLVQEWEYVDKTNIVMKLREGVTWHEGHRTNGRELTAEDIAYNIMRMGAKLDPDRADLFQRRTLLQGLENAEATDETTIKVTLSKPNAAFMIGLSDARQFVTAPETAEADPDFQNVVEFTGTGAWMIDSYDDATSTGTYLANPNFWRPGEPYFDRARQVLLADGAAAASAFTSKQIAIVQGSPVINPLVDRGRDDAKYFTSEYVGWDYLRTNQTREPFTDLRVRQALHLALNRLELGDAGHGKDNWDYTGTLPSGLPGSWTADQVSKLAGYNPATKEADIAEAHKLLTAAGFTNGKGIKFSIIPLWIPGNKLTDDPVRAKDQWEKAFPDMEISITPPADGADHARKLGTGDYEMICYVSFPAPDAALEGNQHYGTTGGRNYTKYNNPEAEALIQKTFDELDTTARNEAIDEFQKVLLDDIFILTTNKNRPQWWLDPNMRGFDETNIGPGGFGGYDITYYAHQLWMA